MSTVRVRMYSTMHNVDLVHGNVHVDCCTVESEPTSVYILPHEALYIHMHDLAFAYLALLALLVL